MPRAVTLALVVASFMLVLSLVYAGVLVADIWTSGAVARAPGGEGIRFPLGLVIVPSSLALSAAVRRRDGLHPERAFQFALLSAILLGFIAFVGVVIAMMRRDLHASFTVALACLALAVALAVSLSRPPAKAWFAVGTDRRA